MNRHRLLHMLAWAAAIALIILPIVAAHQGWFASERWPFRQLSIQGKFVEVDEAQIRTAIAPALSKGFFAVNLQEIKQRVESLPWVEHAEVRKRWPDLLLLHITERQAVATWGESQLLSTNGNLFEVAASNETEQLPNLNGPKDLHKLVWKFYIEARDHLAETGLTLVAARLSDRGAWTLTLTTGGVLVLGQREASKRLAHFSEVFHEIPGVDAERLLSADLRYANGFALRWNTQPETSLPSFETPTPAVPTPELTTPPDATELPAEAIHI